MSCDCDDNCGSTEYTKCVIHQSDISKVSEFKGKENNQFNINENLLSRVKTIEDSLDTSDLGKGNIKYDTDPLDQKSVNKKFEELLSSLDVGGSIKSGLGVNMKNLDLKCLAKDDCDRSIANLEELLQAIINKICN